VVKHHIEDYPDARGMQRFNYRETFDRAQWILARTVCRWEKNETGA
jgi:hypothetical protein